MVKEWSRYKMYYIRDLFQIWLVCKCLISGHEFGHNWGSSHDSDTSKECAPPGDRFMMYPAAVDGSQDNNYYFSPCSKRAINDVGTCLHVHKFRSPPFHAILQFIAPCFSQSSEF